MRKIIICLLFLTSCHSHYDAQEKGLSGHAYLESKQVALMAPCISSRDLTDEEMEEAENLPGGGYSDGKWTGENPPENEDSNGDPTYAAQHVWEDDDGTIIILEDDGEITYVTQV